jgi:hypothetical protein
MPNTADPPKTTEINASAKSKELTRSSTINNSQTPTSNLSPITQGQEWPLPQHPG